MLFLEYLRFFEYWFLSHKFLIFGKFFFESDEVWADIKSLYTHVPLKEVIEDILTTIYITNINSIFKETMNTKILLRKLYSCAPKVFSFMVKKSTK